MQKKLKEMKKLYIMKKKESKESTGNNIMN